MINQIVLFVLVVSCVSANLSFTDCGSTFAIHALRIQGCNATPCVLRRGQLHIIEMDLTAKSTASVLPLRITGHPLFLPPITILTGNGCSMLIRGSCPTKSGKKLTARINYTVSNWLPAVNIPVRFTVRDDANRTPVCGQIPVRIIA